jgi:hypothetical protein
VSEAAQQGQCRCGGVRFEAQGAPLVTMACHCKGCQLMSGSAFSLSSLYPAETVVVNGDTVRGGLKTGPNHSFCPSCMSWLFTVPEGMDAFVNVRSALFERAGEHRPYLETYRSEGLSWAETGAPRRYETVPGDDEFGELMAGYAAWDGRVKQ